MMLGEARIKREWFGCVVCCCVAKIKNENKKTHDFFFFFFEMLFQKSIDFDGEYEKRKKKNYPATTAKTNMRKMLTLTIQFEIFPRKYHSASATKSVARRRNEPKSGMEVSLSSSRPESTIRMNETTSGISFRAVDHENAG